MIIWKSNCCIYNSKGSTILRTVTGLVAYSYLTGEPGPLFHQSILIMVGTKFVDEYLKSKGVFIQIPPYNILYDNTIFKTLYLPYHLS